MAGNRIASGQITIVDLNDGKAVQAYTSALQGETQIYNPDTKVFTPVYTASSPQLVTAHVYVTGSSADQAATAACAGWTWEINGTPVTETGDISFNKNVLSMKRNIPSSAKIMNIKWTCHYTDPETGAGTMVQGYKTLTLVSSGGATGVVIFELPNGDRFDENTPNLQTLEIEARLYRGGTQDTTVKSAVWEKLDISSGTWKSVSSETVSALTGGMSKLTVKADDILNFQSYRCKMTDTETNEVFTAFTTLVDATDEYTVEIVGGDKIVNGAGSVTIAARVWRGGTEPIETEKTPSASRQFEYTWTKLNPYTNQPTNWSGTSSTTKTDNPLTVSASDVDVRVIIYCEVTKK